MDGKAGRAYPFGQFGSLITDAPLGFALETQTLAIYGNTLITDPVAVSAPTMLHELSHQWFGLQSYYGGALTLYALRRRIGVADFDRLERAWVSKFRGRSASTADFISLASAISGHDQNAFLRSWLYGTKTPPMPGHPDWTVTPVS